MQLGGVLQWQPSTPAAEAPQVPPRPPDSSIAIQHRHPPSSTSSAAYDFAFALAGCIRALCRLPSYVTGELELSCMVSSPETPAPPCPSPSQCTHADWTASQAAQAKYVTAARREFRPRALNLSGQRRDKLGR
ncbi:hypothetical protein Dda_2037 [Drechslerella dactyloides]|uniref:Uncharacterized protein n=1 Tax=Drechslerella dactyloides TaxID=74499 RepID=A0AAD6J2S2_DREDA|nr:hypothetical protein Dda_2037 [Drechslerella dactyloides]